MKHLCHLLVLLAGLTTVVERARAEEPLGLLLAASGATIVRPGIQTPLSAKTGELIFAGDSVRAETGSVSFLYCPGRVSHTLNAPGELVFERDQIRRKSGSLSSTQPMGACRLPTVVRVAAASRQHYGVTMVRGLGGQADAVALDPTSLAPDVRAELAAIGSGSEPASVVARAAVLEKAGLSANALVEYRAAATLWPDAVWVKGKIFELQEQIAEDAARKVASTAATGETFAVLVGISKYQKLPQDLWLGFANADATSLHQHLLSPRGGAVPAENMHLLTDEKATTAAVRSVLQTFERGRAGKNDTVLLFFAGHGTVEVPGSKSAFVVTHDTDPQDLSSTGLPMAEIQELIQKLTQVGRVIALVDVCRSGTIGTIRSTTVNSAVERLGESDGELFGLMASRPKEVSYEGPQFGGGHGAFSYYLLKALKGDADTNKDAVVNVNELIEYVRTNVATGTGDKQHPRDFGNIDNSIPLSDVKKPGVDVAHSFSVIELGAKPVYLASARPALPPQPPDLSEFRRALTSGRLLPNERGSAFERLLELKNALVPDQYLALETELRVALEEQAQQVLLKYLAGEEIPQTKQDFSSADDLMTAALKLTPESLYLDARQAFFRGRALLFDKQFQTGAELLERVVRLEPAGGYAYNALGIAYLEQGNLERAIPAFRDASSRAPHWVYPLHNLALCLVETGDYEGALRTYKEAIRLRPEASYLPYNMGLVYQRLNLTREAESAYRKAAALAPASAEPLNALGSLRFSAGKYREAEALYRQALDKDGRLLAARHNLALTVSRDRNRLQEAVDLWRTNLAVSPAHLPSMLGLAELQEGAGQSNEAMSTYRRILDVKPAYAAARMALSALLERTGDLNGALREALTAAETHKDNPDIRERLGDIYVALGQNLQAVEEYQLSLQVVEKSSRKRVSRKLAALQKRP